MLREMLEDWPGRCILLLLVALVAMIPVAIYAAHEEAKEWAAFAKTTDMNELQAAMHAAKETGGMAAVCYLAAFVEMTEPSA